MYFFIGITLFLCIILLIVNRKKPNNYFKPERPEKYWGKVVLVESWSWESVFYWVEEIDEKGKVVVRQSAEKWEKENPNRKFDYEVIIRNVD